MGGGGHCGVVLTQCQQGVKMDGTQITSTFPKNKSF